MDESQNAGAGEISSLVPTRVNSCTFADSQMRLRLGLEVPPKFSPMTSRYGATLRVPERGNSGNPGPQLADHQERRPSFRVNDRSCSNQSEFRYIRKPKASDHPRKQRHF